MNAEAIRLIPRESVADPEGEGDAALSARAHRIVSILTAIEAGELLSELPDCPLAQANHLAAVDLLAIAGEQAQLLMAALDLREAG